MKSRKSTANVDQLVQTLPEATQAIITGGSERDKKQIEIHSFSW